MARLTYTDPNDDAPKIMWQGVTFKAHKAEEVDEEKYHLLVEMAREHPYFTVEDSAPKATWPEEEPPKKAKR